MLYEARGLVELRLFSEVMLPASGILLLTSSVLFYANDLFLRGWPKAFGAPEAALATCQCYLGGLTAFFGTWALLTEDWTALGWAGLFVFASLAIGLSRRAHLRVQAWALAIAVVTRAAAFNSHFGRLYPHRE